MTGCDTRSYKTRIEDSNKTFSLQLSLPCFLHIHILAVNKLCCEGFIISHQHAKNKDTKIYMISSLFAYDLIIQNHGWFHMGTRMVVARGFFLRDPYVRVTYIRDFLVRAPYVRDFFVTVSLWSEVFFVRVFY